MFRATKRLTMSYACRLESPARSNVLPLLLLLPPRLGLSKDRDLLAALPAFWASARRASACSAWHGKRQGYYLGKGRGRVGLGAGLLPSSPFEPSRGCAADLLLLTTHHWLRKMSAS